ncbi:unnamed protein product [Lactuca virosa]|uniref:Uncharacterized protein n=1 Tax=Lactuca virosa TaxID=75947 RepID=A0AAU9NC36_9ASTR|nr:unnamed protein product [Lactuca virosa]
MEYVEVELGDVDIIQSTVQSLLDCVENEKNRSYQLPPSIYMVPRVFRELSPSSFNPRVVFIGPLHREDKKLQEFERYKASCVHDLLHRLDTPTEETLQACVHKVNDLIDRIRACYAGMMSTYGDVDLAKNDGSGNNIIGTDTSPDHILGLLHERYRSPCNISSDLPSSIIPSAAELDMAGVKFEPNRNAKWSMAMEVKFRRFPWLFWFWGKPTFRIPVLQLHDYSELL